MTEQNLNRQSDTTGLAQKIKMSLPGQGLPKNKILLSAMILLVVALGFNALFNFTTLSRLQTEYKALSYHAVGERLTRDICKQLFTGMTLAEIPDLAPRMASAKQLIANICQNTGHQKANSTQTDPAARCDIGVYLPDGSLISSTNPNVLGVNAPFTLQGIHRSQKEQESFIGSTHIASKNRSYFLEFPIKNSQNLWAGSLVISFDKPTPGSASLNRLEKLSLFGIALLFAGGLLLLLVLHFILTRGPMDQSFPRKKITTSMFCIIAPILVLFSGLNTYTSSKQYMQIAHKQVSVTLHLVRSDIEQNLNQGARTLEKAINSDGRFERLIKPYTIIDSLLILDMDKNWVYGARKGNQMPSYLEKYPWADHFVSQFPYLNHAHNIPISGKNGKSNAGSVEIRISKASFLSEASNLILNAVTVIAISLLFLIELLIFLFHFIDKPAPKKTGSRAVHFGLIRPVTFLFLFGMDLCMSFIPLHMEKLYTPIFGFSKNTVMGLPITVEFCFVGIAIFLSGFWNDRRGWHEPFLTGLFLAGLGNLYSWLSPNVIHFIISRAFVGVGYGLTLLAAQGFVIAFSSDSSRARGFAQFLSGLYAGSICGGATGALLAEKIGYALVFCIGGITLFTAMIYPLIFMRKAMAGPIEQAPVPAPAPGPSKSSGTDKSVFFKFFSNRIVLSLIFLSSLPASFASVGFLHYFSPIYLNRIGVSQGTIGRELMLYGFSLVYLGPVIAKFVDKFDNKKNYVFVGCLLGSAAFLMFYFFEGLIAVTFAILLLGLSNSFIIASQSTYLLRLKVTHALGAGKAIGIFRATSRGGQALGPIIFSTLFLSENIRLSITQLGLYYLLTALLFLLFTVKDNNQYQRYS